MHFSLYCGQVWASTQRRKDGGGQSVKEAREKGFCQSLQILEIVKAVGGYSEVKRSRRGWEEEERFRSEEKSV